jgi:hypothetical protein
LEAIILHGSTPRAALDSLHQRLSVDMSTYV